MGDEGSVGREIVIKVLRSHSVEVSPQQDGMYLLVKENLIEERKLHDQIGRKQLHYLARKFDVPIHHFYNDNSCDLECGSCCDPVN